MHRDIHDPKSGQGGAGAEEDYLVVESHHNVAGSEGDVASCIAELSDGEQGTRRQFRYDVSCFGRCAQVGNVHLCGMGRFHSGTIWVGDMNRVLSHSNIVHRGAEWEDMGGATCVADGSKCVFAVALFGCGGTYYRVTR